jgi:peptide/nickel transport system permease protein
MARLARLPKLAFGVAVVAVVVLLGVLADVASPQDPLRQSLGAKLMARLVLRHLLPNMLSTCIVLATVEAARMIILESALSFLGLGVQPPNASWGGMLRDGKLYISAAWWYTTFPGLAIMLTVLGLNMVGDSLRDLLDPRLRV